MSEITIPEQVLFCAFRDAIGRRTNDVATVAAEIRKNAAVLSDRVKYTIIGIITHREIEMDLGEAEDVAEWLRTRQTLERHL